MRNLTKQINFRSNPLTRQRLHSLCARTRLSQGALLRYFIEQAWLNAFSPGSSHEK